MSKPMKIIMLFFKNIFYIFLLLLVFLGILYSLGNLINHTVVREPPTCENNVGNLMRIKKIISVVDYVAELEMEDHSIEKYVIKYYVGRSKNTSIINLHIKVNGVICVYK